MCMVSYTVLLVPIIYFSLKVFDLQFKVTVMHMLHLYLILYISWLCIIKFITLQLYVQGVKRLDVSVCHAIKKLKKDFTIV